MYIYLHLGCDEVTFVIILAIKKKKTIDKVDGSEDGRICRIAVHIFRILMKNEKVKRKRLFRGSNLRSLFGKMF